VNNEFNEPWRVAGETPERRVVDSTDTSVSVGGDYYNDGWFKPDVAARIVACVNACKGIPTDVLQKVTRPTIRIFDDKLLVSISARAAWLLKIAEAFEILEQGPSNIDCKDYCTLSKAIQEAKTLKEAT